MAKIGEVVKYRRIGGEAVWFQGEIQDILQNQEGRFFVVGNPSCLTEGFKATTDTHYVIDNKDVVEICTVLL